jgi:hypothetical protein
MLLRAVQFRTDRRDGEPESSRKLELAVVLSVVQNSPVAPKSARNWCATETGAHKMLQKTIIVGALAGALFCLAQQAAAQESRRVHEGNWPIQGGVKHQPTRDAAGGEFSRSQAEETDKLYDELLSNSFSATHHPGTARMR